MSPFHMRDCSSIAFLPTKSVSFCTNSTTVFIHAKEITQHQKAFASHSRI